MAHLFTATGSRQTVTLPAALGFPDNHSSLVERACSTTQSRDLYIQGAILPVQAGIPIWWKTGDKHSL